MIIELKANNLKAFCVADDFDIDLYRELLIEKLLSCVNKQEADEFIISLFNEGVLIGNTGSKDLAKPKYLNE